LRQRTKVRTPQAYALQDSHPNGGIMQLEGSCQCGAVRFTLESKAPIPYQRCYCSICRKTQGGGGYAINIGGDAQSLKVEGLDQVTIYHARIRNPGEEETVSSAERCFCKHCGSALWIYSLEWPDLIYPFASAIDTPLPAPPETTHIMLQFKAPWVEVQQHEHDKLFDDYPEEALVDWHARVNMAG
jgi:hypothetical protein